jgi:hypothetical protein
MLNVKQGANMSVNDYIDEFVAEALEAFHKAGAITYCSDHDVTIRKGDEDAERRAYAIATANLRRQRRMDNREDVMATIQNQLDEAADDECPRCAHFRDQ